MVILGISAFYHDSAAALLVNGKVVAACSEERFTRVKHDKRFPFMAIKSCMEQAGITYSDIDAISFYDKPFIKFERILETYLNFAPSGFVSFVKSLPIWVKDKLFQKKKIIDCLKFLDPSINWKEILFFSEHHLSHAASAFFPSPFESSIILTMDGVGEWTTTSICLGQRERVVIKREIAFPHSLGLLYSAFTYFLGFKVNSGEYKVMGLAPYGKPIFKELILEKLIDLKEDGSFRLDMSYFSYCTGLKMTNKKFSKLFGVKRRLPEEEIEQLHKDIAASIQAVCEEVVITLAKYTKEKYGGDNLCLAGGVALNCVANGKLRDLGIFENIWVQPAAGDSGGALGAALALYHLHFNKIRILSNKDKMEGSLLGPSFREENIKSYLDLAGAKYKKLQFKSISEIVANNIASGAVVGWFQGRMEYGPRALGNRSIIADPRSPKMQKSLNMKIKFRESFRPFAPSVLEDSASSWFDLKKESPYMLFVSSVNDSANLPAITHVDNSARIQTVSKTTNPRFYQLISSFEKLTGCPVLINTSFNVRGEPIVCTPEDAYRCFMGTDMDYLVIGDFYLKKSEQPKELIETYYKKFDLD